MSVLLKDYPRGRLLFLSVSRIAIIAAVCHNSAQAGSCDDIPPLSGSFTCSGPADPSNDRRQLLRTSGQSITVTTAPSFGLDNVLESEANPLLGPMSGFDLVNFGSSNSDPDEAGITFQDNNQSQITSAGDAIVASNNAGDLTIFSNGQLTSLERDGLRAINEIAFDGYATSETRAITITTAGIEARLDGIDVFNGGTGDTSVFAGGQTIGTAGDGIIVQRLFANDGVSPAGAIMLVAEDVLGGDNGIAVVARDQPMTDSAPVNITVTGTATGVLGDGVALTLLPPFSVGNPAAPPNVALRVNNSSGVSGISVRDTNGSDTNITVTGSVTGTGDSAIHLETEFNPSVYSVRLEAGATLSSATGEAINVNSQSVGSIGGNTRDLDASSFDLVVNPGAAISGSIMLEGTVDTITLAGGDVAGVTSISAGDDPTATDVFLITGLSVLPGQLISGFETTQIDGGEATFSDGLFAAAPISGLQVVNDGVLQAPNLSVTGDISASSGGIINLLNGVAGDVLELTGDITSSGILRIDVDPALSTEDLIRSTAGQADIAGRLEVNVINTPPGETEHIVVTAVNGATDSGTELQQNALIPPDDTVITEFMLEDRGNDLVLVVATNFTPIVPDPPTPNDVPALTAVGTNFGNYLNSVAGNSELAGIVTIAQQAPDIQTLDTIYQTLSGVEFNQITQEALFSSPRFGQRLFECNRRGGQEIHIGVDWCTWAQTEWNHRSKENRPESPAFAQSTFGLNLGGMKSVGGNFWIGGGLGYERIDYNGELGFDASADRLRMGVSAQYLREPWSVGLGLAAGFAWVDSERNIFGATANSNANVFDISILARASYHAQVTENIYFEPELRAAVTHTSRSSFTERGAGAADLSVARSTTTALALSPSIEVGANYDWNDFEVFPYLRFGATFLSDDSTPTVARLADATSSETFLARAVNSTIYADVAAGIELFNQDNVTIAAEYQGGFSSDTTVHGAFLRVDLKF